MDIVTLEIIMAVLGTGIYCVYCLYLYQQGKWKYMLLCFLFVMLVVAGLWYAYEVLAFLFGK